MKTSSFNNSAFSECPFGFPVHIVCPTRDPLDPKAWSGTPLRLYETLNDMGLAGKAIHPKPPPYVEKFDQLSRKMSSGGSYAGVAKILAEILDWKYMASLTKSLCATGPVIFMGISRFPAQKPIPNTFVLVDAVWHQWMQTQMKDAYQRLSPKQKKNMWIQERQVYHAATHVFTFAEYVRDEIIQTFQLPPERISAVGSGISLDETFLRTTAPKDFSMPKFLFLSKSLSEEKGADLLVEAFRHVRSAFPNATLTLAGNEAYAERFGHESGVTGLGYFTPKSPEIRQLYSRHTHFVLPARNEAWGYVFLEALAMGLPVIGLNENAFPEITRNGTFGWGIPEWTSSSVADTMMLAISRMEELDVLSEKARNYVRLNYSWEKTVRTILRVIQDSKDKIS